MSSDKLCKRYLFNLEMIVKSKAPTSKKIEGPPRMLYLRELYASIHQVFKEPISAVVRSIVGLPRPLPATSNPVLTPARDASTGRLGSGQRGGQVRTDERARCHGGWALASRVACATREEHGI